MNTVLSVAHLGVTQHHIADTANNHTYHIISYEIHNYVIIYCKLYSNLQSVKARLTAVVEFALFSPAILEQVHYLTIFDLNLRMT